VDAGHEGGGENTDTPCVGACLITPLVLTTDRSLRRGPLDRAPTLGEIIRTFKAATSHSIHSQETIDFKWQRNYYEHVICNDYDLDHIRQYIINNPIHWTEDDLYKEEVSTL
jgi:putative transposase